MTALQTLIEELSELGYSDMEQHGDSITGIVSGIDLSKASRSPPNRKGTGPFATLNDAESHIPEDIIQACKRAGADISILGNGGYSEDSYLHLKIKLGE